MLLATQEPNIWIQNTNSMQERSQGRIQSKFEGGAVGSGGAENFSKIGNESTLYRTISDPFSDKQHNF